MSGVDEEGSVVEDDGALETDASNPSLSPFDRRDTDPSSGAMSSPDRAPTNPSRIQKSRASTSSQRKKRRGIRDEHVGKTLGEKYRVEKLIAKGGMGRVYLATQFPLERPVAIKILNREFQQSDPQFVKRFFLEASIAAQLSHPHTITVFDYGDSETGDLYIAMEYLEGRPLSRILRTDGPYAAEEALRLSMQIARALRAAHEKGVIHRDLKPGNIFILEEGDEEAGAYAKVLDFGLVKLFTPEGEEGNAFGASMLGEGDVELTRTGTLLGSPKYMSPEQIQGLPLDPRTDVYSFGIIMYQMMSGKAPFSGATGVDVIYKHVNFPVPPIATQNPAVDCPPEIEGIIRTCLEKKRDDRYASMMEVIDAIKEAQKLVTGVSLAGDSISVSGHRQRVAGNVSASMSKSRSKSRALEASFREPLTEEPTPPGLLNPAESGARVSPKPNRLPLLIAGTGFAVALMTLGYVMFGMPSQEPPPVKRTAPIVQKAPPEERTSPPPVRTPTPPPTKTVSPPPPAETAETPTHTTKKKRRPLKRKPIKKTRTRPEKTETPDVELPPNYRENPY